MICNRKCLSSKFYLNFWKSTIYHSCVRATKSSFGLKRLASENICEANKYFYTFCFPGRPGRLYWLNESWLIDSSHSFFRAFYLVLLKYLVSLHHFIVTIPECYLYANTLSLPMLDSENLPFSCWTLTYNLNSFSIILNRHPFTVLYDKNSPYFLKYDFFLTLHLAMSQ